MQRTATPQNLLVNSDIIFNTLQAGNIPYNTSTGVATLSGGSTYRISVVLSIANIEASLSVALVDSVTNSPICPAVEYLPTVVQAATASASNIDYIYTPSTNKGVKVRVTAAGALVSGADVRSDAQSCMVIVKLK